MGKVLRVCEVCNKKFYVVLSVVKIGRGRFCSRGCYGQWLSENSRGENHPNWQGQTREYNCLICGTVFKVRLAHVKQGAGKYCSRKCHFQAQRGYRKYASDADNPLKVLCTCKACGSQFYHWENSLRKGEGRYCSRECMGRWRSENYVGVSAPNWRGGQEPYPEGWRESVRESIRKRDGRSCVVCGQSKIDEGKAMCVHHIDYNKNNLDSQNLVALCQSCHSRTNYNRDFWQDNLAEYMAVAM